MFKVIRANIKIAITPP